MSASDSRRAASPAVDREPVRRLVLLRHAKAKSPAGVADADRPLAGKGRGQVLDLAHRLLRNGLAPDHVVVSPARRARQTWDLLAEDAVLEVAVETDARVYANTVEDLVAVVHDADPAVATLLLVGHNPALSAFAVELDDTAGDAAGSARIADGLPTCGLAAFTLAVPWARVGPGCGHLLTVLTPTR